jgi:hypothetical protein
MLKHLYLILIATFVFGFLTGVILFLQNNTGKEGDGGIQTNTKGFTILAYEYGGCTKTGGCPSYRIANDGSYSYITRDSIKGEAKHDDSLSSKQFEALRTRLGEVDFNAIDDTEFKGTCPSATGGIAYRYDIEYQGERHEVDSCIEIIGNQPLFKMLEDYFGIFTITYGTE